MATANIVGMGLKPARKRPRCYLDFHQKTYVACVAACVLVLVVLYSADQSSGFAPQTSTTLVDGRAKFALVILATAKDAGDLNRLFVSVERWCVGYDAIFIYHNGDLDRSALTTDVLRDPALTRLVELTGTDWDRLPEGFDPSTRVNDFKKRSEWGYNHMIRFWFADVFWRPELQAFDYLVRLDSDACLFGPLVLPDAIEPHHVYKPNVWNADRGEYVEGLWDTVQNYISKEKIEPRNTWMWSLSLLFHKRLGRELGYYNNFEITRREFFQQPNVKSFTDRIVSQAPYGIYKHRWGDAILRYITLALFSSREEIAPAVDVYLHPTHSCGAGVYNQLMYYLRPRIGAAGFWGFLVGN